jgi:ribosomal protein S27E
MYISSVTPSEGALMAHFKCVVCKTRQYCAARPADGVGDLCPGCGSLLEPVGELAEIFGFRRRQSVIELQP